MLVSSAIALYLAIFLDMQCICLLAALLAVCMCAVCMYAVCMCAAGALQELAAWLNTCVLCAVRCVHVCMCACVHVCMCACV
jgi:hypothetical protein